MPIRRSEKKLGARRRRTAGSGGGSGLSGELGEIITEVAINTAIEVSGRRESESDHSSGGSDSGDYGDD